ncbi:non-ribosomal peptide synthetase [Paenibacillus thiaminolyticus]|uniref:non-ribosomal peptide synthetase n=1 Tax=Paenibacillus thiaminolyticus TaxID=49283 RepID=UPI0025427009|nr:non-ribosomal peptide synthetase [Paenibacillus thiaminolyticus]WII35952.1 amino acid adenylation domain-containing protein [Paenibacillus thiaminolyticus]
MKQGNNESLNYWLNQFNGEWETGRFPYDSSAMQSSGRERETVRNECSHLLYEDLLKISGGSPTGIFIVLLSAISELLYRYTGVNNMVIGVPGIHNSMSADEVKPVLPVTISNRRDQSFKELIMTVKEKVANAVGHQSYSYSELINTINSGNSIVDTLVMLDPLHISYPNLDTAPSILIMFELTGSSLICEMNYNTKSYETETIEQIFSHLEHLLAKLLRSPGSKPKDIILAPKNEFIEIRGILEGAKRSDYQGHTLDRLFEEQVMLVPDQPAVTYLEQSVTFMEMDKKSSATARYLQHRGFSPGDLIGIMSNHPIEIAVSILGILKAGCAYVPIDPEYPIERIEYILEHSGIKGILLNKGEVFTLIPDHVTVLTLAEISFDEMDVPFHSLSHPDGLAYIVYTSGSTGRPKGVMVEHRSIANSLLWRKEEYSLDRTDRVLQLLSFAFDGFITSFFTPLLSGAQSIFPARLDTQDPLKLGFFISEHQISHFISTPSLFNELLEHPDSRNWSSLKVVTLAGEPMNQSTIMKCRNLLPNLEIANEYGPTENSVVTTCQRNVERASRISIGRPVANSKLFILDADGNEQPFGVPGELCISGYSLARGYLQEPQLTKSSFLPLFSEPETNTRLYRTGDMVKLYADSTIEYVGRKDQQVKIRGFRIELGEISSALLQHNQVDEAVVKACEGTNSDKSLCAYVTGHITEDSSALKSFLSNLIPSYMIPDHIVIVDKLPKNRNGKVDLNSLPDPLSVSTFNERSGSPSTEMEVEIHQIWCDLLSREAIGVEDNLFQLGAHSLKIASFISHTYRKFKIVIMVSIVFQNPTIRGLAQIIQREKQKTITPIRQVELRPYYPLSSAQRRLFFLNEIHRESTHYNMPGAVILSGYLEEHKIRETLQLLITRHEALRTCIEWRDGEPVQIILHEVEPDYLYAEIDEQALDYHMKSFIKPFHLEHAPLFRVRLLRLSPEKHMLLLDMHHIISDGFSIQIMLHDFVQLYGKKTLESLDYQYKDYAVWQEEFLATELFTKQQAYWTSKLAGELPILELPLDFPRKPEKSYTGQMLSFQIDHEAVLKLRNQFRGTTLFAALLTVYYVLLAKYTGQEDIIIGIPVAGRSRRELEPIVGMFVNTLAIRNFPEKHKTVIQFVEEVQRSVIEAFDNQDIPFEMIVENLQLPRALNRNPLFDTMFAFQLAEEDKVRLEIDGLTAERSTMINQTTKFDLSMHLSDTASGVVVHVEYDDELFTKDRMERFCMHYTQLVVLVSEKPEAALQDLCMLHVHELDELLQLGRGECYKPLPEQTLANRLRKQAQCTPDRPALLYGDDSMTYRELEDASGRVAHDLIQAGCQGQAVALLMERSAEMVIAILGIVKAGAAFVPIDPAFPEKRVQYMLADCGARLMLTDASNQDMAVRLWGEQVAVWGPNLKTAPSLPERAALPALPEGLAYILYTSGSTGQPKGVLVKHPSILNTLRGLHERYPMGPQDVYLFKTAYTFDVSLSELWGWMWGGGALAILEPGGEKNPAALAAAIQRYGVTHINFVPPMLSALIHGLDEEGIKALQGLRYIFAAGEALPGALAREVVKKLPEVRLENLYGPTEVSIYATGYSVTGTEEGGIPIGRPLPNVHVYIMDEGGALQPIGVPGELYVGGAGVAAGYVNREAQTAERFMVDPYVEGGRMYRTGDLARWNREGQVEYLGRTDDQVKIRGYRIELGEVEKQLLETGLVREAVVVSKTGPAGFPYLCAYVTTQEPLKTEEVRAELGTRVPSYMIPGHIIRLETIPLNSSGKADRRALADLNMEWHEHSTSYEAPRTGTERKLAALWSEILGIQEDEIGIHDSFFELGGHSLSILRFLARTASQAWNIGIKDFYTHKTIAALAQQIDQGHLKRERTSKMERIDVQPPQKTGLNFDSTFRKLRTVLLTGVTGFLGAHIAKDLLEDKEVQLYCLLRGESVQECQVRLEARFDHYFKDLSVQYKQEIGERLHLIPGSIESIEWMSQSGLPKLDGIIHAAALVKHYGDYEQFNLINVKSTENLLRYAEAYNIPFHYISTMSVSGSQTVQASAVFTEDCYDIGQLIEEQVYVRSKFEAERLVIEAMNRGFNACIYRIGNLTGRYSDGVFQPNMAENRFYARLKSFIEIGVVSTDLLDMQVEFTPVDYCVKSLLKLVELHTESGGGIYHLYHPCSLTVRKIADMLGHLHHPIREMDRENYEQYLTQLSLSSQGQELLMGMVGDRADHDAESGNPVRQDNRYTIEVLSRLGVQWPEINIDYISKIVSHMSQTGFLSNRDELLLLKEWRGSH